ncbi:MAG: KH domain-containing protein, partial [Candidatus Pacearchaeota archaeon]|nr:KH domain-containing protein [Candidatus Pacearchaeota archaeon]
MVKTLIITKLPRIIRNKKKLEEKLNIKITNRGKEITIQGSPEDEFIAEKVFDALEFGFPYFDAMRIKTEECEIEKINIKDYTHRRNLEEVRARVIGTKGKTLKTLSDISDCSIELKENQISIIGPPESIKIAQDAIISIIQ